MQWAVIQRHVHKPKCSTDHSLVVDKSKLHTRMLHKFTLTVVPQLTLAKWLFPNTFKIQVLPRLPYALT